MTNIFEQDLLENSLFRRIMAVGLLSIVLGVILWVYLAFYFSSSERLDYLENIHARYTKAIGSEGALRQRLEELQGASVESVALLSGESDALVGAQLQKRMKQIVGNAGGSLETTQMLPSAQEQALEKITVRASMTVTTNNLQKILYVIETQSPYLFIEEIDIKALSKRRSGDNDQTEKLKVTIDFFGYRKAGASS